MREQLLRVEIRRGHDRFAQTDRIRQRAADDLHRVEIGREIDVGRPEVCQQLVEIEIFVDQLDVVGKTIRGDARLELATVRFAFVAADDRMRLAEDEIQRLGVRCHDGLHRLDCVLEPFAAADEPERRDRHPPREAQLRLALGALAERHVRDAVMDHADLAGIDTIALDEDIAAGFGEDDDHRGRCADHPGHAQMLGRRVGQHGVQRRHHRLADGLDEVDDPLAVLAPEEAVLMLDVQHVAGVGVHEVGGSAVRLTVVLGQPSDDLVGVDAVFTARFIDRDHGTARAERRIVAVDHILQEGRDSALPRRKGTEKKHGGRLGSQRRPLVEAGAG
ncbi:MAG: hypothetical protein NVS3B28_26300 [Candidatus Velthaea sp.]